MKHVQYVYNIPKQSVFFLNRLNITKEEKMNLYVNKFENYIYKIIMYRLFRALLSMNSKIFIDFIEKYMFFLNDKFQNFSFAMNGL